MVYSRLGESKEHELAIGGLVVREVEVLQVGVFAEPSQQEEGLAGEMAGAVHGRHNGGAALPVPPPPPGNQHEGTVGRVATSTQLYNQDTNVFLFIKKKNQVNGKESGN